MPGPAFEETPRLQLPQLMPSQALKHVTINDSFTRLDAVVQCVVESVSQTAQPTAPQAGQAWIIPVGASGPVWAGAPAGALAVFLDGGWRFDPTFDGMAAWIRDWGDWGVRAGGGWRRLVQPGHGRNRLYNGDMALWQRGTPAVMGPGRTFAADRWAVWRAGGSTGLTASREPGPQAGRQAIRIKRAAGDTSTAAIQLLQDLEATDCADLASRNVCLSLRWRTSPTVSGSVRICLVAGGRPADGSNRNARSGLHQPVTLAETTPAQSGSWTRTVLTAICPADLWQLSVQVRVEPSGPATADDWIEVAEVQLETGGVATPFETETLTRTLDRCRRYFAKSYEPDTAPGTATALGALASRTGPSGICMFSPRWPRSMRTAPLVTIYALTGTPVRLTVAGGEHQFAAAIAPSTEGVSLYNTTIPATSEQFAYMHYAAEAEF